MSTTYIPYYERHNPVARAKRTGVPLTAEQTRFEVARQGGKVEAVSGSQMVVSSGKPVNHILHFLLGFVTLGAWWVIVWLPLCIFGGEKRRVLVVGSDTRPPTQMPWVTFTSCVILVAPFVLFFAFGVPFLAGLFFTVLAACAVRALANR